MSSTRKWDQKYYDGDTAATMTSAGTTQSDAAEITAAHVIVTTHSAGAGVILDKHEAGFNYSVVNGSANDGLMVYPPSGVAFNGQTANDPVNLASGTGMQFKAINATKIAAFVAG